MKTILFVRNWSIAGANKGWHGGQLRSLQLEEIARDAGFEIVEFVPNNATSTASVGRKALAACEGMVSQRRLRIEDVARFWRNFGKFEDFFKTRKSDVDTIVWEDTTNYSLFSEFSRFVGNIIAAPHNIESLNGVPGMHYDRRGGGPALDHEMKCLSRANSIMAISAEDQWLIRNFKLDCCKLVYWPPRSQWPVFKIRMESKRKAAKGGPILLLGSATNAPTFEGMQIFLNLYSKIEAPRNKVDVIGWGTERLEKFSSDYISVSGALSSQDLETRFACASGAVVVQVSGTGALTRIPELLMSGLSICCNDHAARGHAHLLEFLDILEITDLPHFVASWSPGEVNVEEINSTISKVRENSSAKFIEKV